MIICKKIAKKSNRGQMEHSRRKNLVYLLRIEDIKKDTLRDIKAGKIGKKYNN